MQQVWNHSVYRPEFTFLRFAAVADCDVAGVQAAHAPPPPLEPPQPPSTMQRITNGALYAGVALVVGTFAITVVNYVRKFNSPEAKGRRKVCLFVCCFFLICAG
jgi:hypothetical protein